MRVELPAKGINSIQVLPYGGFDFSSQLLAGESVVSASTTATVWWGNDPNPSLILGPPPTLNGPLVLQTFQGGVLGNIYLVNCQAITNTLRTLVLVGYLAVVPDY